MTDLRQQLLQEMQLRHYSPRTIELYISSLLSLSKYYGLSPDKLSIDQVKEYLHDVIHRKQVSRSFVNQTISAYKLLCVDVLHRDWESINIKRPRLSKDLPEVLSKEEVKKLLDVTRNLKHRTAFSLGYSSGLRVSEVLHLQKSDIDFDRMQIRIYHGKGSKTRYVPLSARLVSLLHDYMQSYPTKSYLFEGYRKGEPLSNRSLFASMRKWSKIAGITKKASFHTLRHSYATHLLEQGVDIKRIQLLLGHKSIRTTSVYLHVQDGSHLSIPSPFDSL